MESQIVLSIASAGALVISIASFVFAVLSWRESHRPIVTARISTDHGGNMAVPVELVVENTGNRPALHVSLEVDPIQLDNSLNDSLDPGERARIGRCFAAETFIPVLDAGQSASNAFGVLREGGGTWVYKSILNIGIRYQGLNGRKFYNKIPVWLVDNQGFALSFYRFQSSS